MDHTAQKILVFFLALSLHTAAVSKTVDNRISAAQARALQYVHTSSVYLQQSIYFKHVTPDSFIAQLATRIQQPYTLNQGKTVFCWMAAPLAYFYAQDPEGMAAAVISLYLSGKFVYTNCGADLSFSPSQEIFDAVGPQVFHNKKDPLFGKVVDQMVFLSFADHYKCWMNIDRHFDPGDENKSTWGGGTLGKEAEIWKAFGYDIKRHGFNIFWFRANKVSLAQQALQINETAVLYVNAPRFNQDWARVKLKRQQPPYIRTGTHYILVTQCDVKDGNYYITFWDDDGVQHYTMSEKLFQQCVYGVLEITKPPVTECAAIVSGLSYESLQKAKGD